MKHPIAFLLIAITLLHACKKQESVLPIPADHVVLRTSNPIATSAGITVFADSVWISICPKTANCFAPDNLSANLRLVRGQESQSLRLFAWFSGGARRELIPSDSASVRLGGQLYKVILKGQYTGETDNGRIGRALLQVAPL